MGDPGPAADDEERLAAIADALADGVTRALPRWVEQGVARRHEQWAGRPPDEPVAEAARRVGQQAAEEVGGAVRALLALDVDRQWTNPLAVVRSAVAYPTRVLADAGVPAVVRDAEAERQFPDDVYDLTPGSFAALDPDLHEPGLVWGAAKAHVVLARRRAEGRR